MARIIEQDKSVIPACDFGPTMYRKMLKEFSDSDEIGAFKTGYNIKERFGGLKKLVQYSRDFTDKPLIHDEQKLVPDPKREINEFKLDLFAESGIDGIIVFPYVDSAEQQEEWIDLAKNRGLNVIVGGKMTSHMNSGGGYALRRNFLDDIYINAAKQGIENFYVPGTDPSFIKYIRERVNAFEIDPVFYSAGFVAQGGNISDAARHAGENFHAIVGTEMHRKKNENRCKTKNEMRSALEGLFEQLYSE